MIRSLILFLVINLIIIVLATEDNEADEGRYLKNDKDLSSLRRKFGLFFDPDETRGESRAALRYILTFFSKRPGSVEPTVPAMNRLCGEAEDETSSFWHTGGGYTTKSLLPAIIGTMKESALYSII